VLAAPRFTLLGVSSCSTFHSSGCEQLNTQKELLLSALLSLCYGLRIADSFSFSMPRLEKLSAIRFSLSQPILSY
jgi:hypothetical protein